MSLLSGILDPLRVPLFVLFAAPVYGQTFIPETPAGKVLRPWLDAFNSRDRAKTEAYIKNFEPEKLLERRIGFQRLTGGFDLLATDRSEPHEAAP